MSPVKARASDKTLTAQWAIHDPAKQPVKDVAGVVGKRTMVAGKRDQPLERLKCKKRPDSKKPSGRGAGMSRDFVPWCK